MALHFKAFPDLFAPISAKGSGSGAFLSWSGDSTSTSDAAITKRAVTEAAQPIRRTSDGQRKRVAYANDFSDVLFGIFGASAVPAEQGYLVQLPMVLAEQPPLHRVVLIVKQPAAQVTGRRNRRLMGSYLCGTGRLWTCPEELAMYRICRYFSAAVLLFYGFAKINGAQFTVLESELDKPMGKVSGFWLTWHYFGFSPAFATLVALSQIALALLLCWRRTTLLASCMGLVMMCVILLIDVAYGVDAQGTMMALLTAMSLGFIVAQHRRGLLRLFWTEQIADHPPRPRGRRVGKIAALTAFAVTAGVGTYWIANENNRLPTPLDGAWSVTAGQRRLPGMHHPIDKVYFERNRAYMVVFRFGDKWAQHHFEVNPSTKTLNIWEHWLDKDAQVFTGTYRFAGSSHLLLAGKFSGSNAPVQLKLDRDPSTR